MPHSKHLRPIPPNELVTVQVVPHASKLPEEPAESSSEAVLQCFTNCMYWTQISRIFWGYYHHPDFPAFAFRSFIYAVGYSRDRKFRCFESFHGGKKQCFPAPGWRAPPHDGNLQRAADTQATGAAAAEGKVRMSVAGIGRVSTTSRMGKIWKKGGFMVD